MSVTKLQSVLLAFVVFVLYVFFEEGRKQNEQKYSSPTPTSNPAPYMDEDDPAWGNHRLSVIVPYRGAFDELLLFVPHLHQFLNARMVRHKICIIHQVDNYRFNRGFLINIGFLLSRDKFDYMVMHDIDLLPVNPLLNYSYPDEGPYHLSSPEYHPQYGGKRFIGGVLLFTMKDFAKVQGMTNGDWGWGGEDNELYTRIRVSKLKLTRASGLTTGRKTFMNIHDVSKRPRDKERFDTVKGNQFKLDSEYGFSNAKYNLQRVVAMEIDDAPVTIYNVELQCDVTKTPWCQTNYTVADYKSRRNIKNKDSD